MIMNGVLGGLVGITAGCASMNTASAALTGAIGGAVVFFGIGFVERVLKVDDVPQRI